VALVVSVLALIAAMPPFHTDTIQDTIEIQRLVLNISNLNGKLKCRREGDLWETLHDIIYLRK
jgi:hypothetical protein